MKKEVTEKEKPSPFESSESFISLSVSQGHAGQRIDRFLSLKLEGVGRKLAGELCEGGKVRVDGRRVRKSFCLKAETTVIVADSPFGRALPAPEIPLSIVFSSPDLVIVEKAAGIPCGALPGKEAGTMAGALLARFPEMRLVGYSAREPGIVHRLDNHTSGLLLAARHQKAFFELRDALSQGRIKKRYLALVSRGTLPDEGSVTTPLMHCPKDKRRVQAASEGEGQPCRTDFRIVDRSEHFDLVEAQAGAAFRHQIRVHLASLGAPLVGDLLYGGSAALNERHALHASYIKGSGAGSLSFFAESRLPDDLRRVFDEGR